MKGGIKGAASICNGILYSHKNNKTPIDATTWISLENMLLGGRRHILSNTVYDLSI